MKQKELSILLRAVVVLCWCGCALVGGLIVPAMAWETAKLNPELAYLKWPCLLFFWCALAVVVAALVHAYRIFADIGRDRSFTAENARRLRLISHLALGDTLAWFVGTVALAALAPMHPMFLFVMLAVVVGGVAVTVAASVLSHLTLKAADLQDENDLTI